MSKKYFVWFGLLFAAHAFSDVYVAPYVGDGEIKYSTPPPIKSAPMVEDAITRKDINDKSPNRVRRENLGQGSNGSVGREVPLRQALEMVYPSAGWKYNVDPELDENMPVSWEGANAEDGIIQSIARQNGLYIAVNPDDHTIGISRDSNIAHLLANRIPRVWFVQANTDLQSLVKRWAAIAEKKVGFAINDNYRISYPAVIQGTFIDALNQLLASVADEKVPMIAKRSTNDVFTIERGGWQAP